MTSRSRVPLGRALWLALILGIFLVLPLAASWQAVEYKYSTYIGGNDVDRVTAVTTGPDGITYFAGMTWASDFQWTHTNCGPPQYEPPPRIFVLALDPSGRFLYSSCIHVAQRYREPVATGIAVARDGSVFVAYNDVVYNGLFYESHAYAARLSLSGELIYRWTLESGLTRVQGIAVDDGSNAYIVGYILGPWPFIDRAAFIIKLTPGGTTATQTYLDGLGAEEATAILRDTAGNFLVVGSTDSSDLFHGIPGLPRRPYMGGQDAFVLKLAPTDGAFTFFTYLGGSGQDRAAEIALSPSGDLLVAGDTNSQDFPHAAQLPETYGHMIGFLARLSPEGAPLDTAWLGRGGSPTQAAAQALALDGRGSLYWMGSAGTLPPIGDENIYCEGSHFARLHPESLEILQATCLWMAFGRDLTVGPDGYPVVAGGTYDWLPMVNAMDPVFDDSHEGFAMKFTMNRAPDCSAATASPGTLWPPNGKLVPVFIQGVSDPDSDPISVKITSARQDEPLSRNGSDVTGLGTPAAMVRADRLGGGDGRVYHLGFEARDSHGAVCTGMVSVCVPHDQQEGLCGDGGLLFESTAR